MKLPRWLTLMMLGMCTLAVPATACSLWSTWPSRTAGEFVDLAAEHNWVQVENMFERAPDRVIVHFWVTEELASWGRDELKADPRTWLELCDGRQHFRMTRSRIEFTVKRGKVIELIHSTATAS